MSQSRHWVKKHTHVCMFMHAPNKEELSSIVPCQLISVEEIKLENHRSEIITVITDPQSIYKN